MNVEQVGRINLAARKMDRALKLLEQAREELNAVGAYEDDDLFNVTSNLTDAMAATSAAFTTTHMAAYVWRQESQQHQTGGRS